MRFSERKGFTEVSKTIVIEDANEDLRNTIWNVLHNLKWSAVGFKDFRAGIDNPANNSGKSSIGQFSKFLWFDYFKKPIDNRPSAYETFIEIKDYFFRCRWYEFYNLLEFTLNYFESSKLNIEVNLYLERELSGYRFVGGQITDITNKQEVEMLEKALIDEDFPNVKAHLQRALELLSDRKNPDYRNSIKESISAVESIAKEIAQKPKAELGEALKEIEKKGKLHGAMKNAFLNLYGYTSDADGIRHALMEEPNLTANDAKFFLLTCTSFINYLKAKM